MAESAVRLLNAADGQQMHDFYRLGGKQRQMAPHVVYSDPTCPYPDCDQRMQAIDFRVEEYGRAVHDALVAAWWNDIGFAGRCPKCGRWVHFTIRGKRPVAGEAASQLPQLPTDWFVKATVL